MIATVKLSIPVPSSMLVVNILGVLAMVGLTVSAGALTGNWWWSLPVGSLFMLVLSLVGAAHVATAERPVRSVAAARSEPRAA